MTLSICDENGFKILGVDMLGSGTMRAGTDGVLLVRTMNDLRLLASFISDPRDEDWRRGHDEEIGFSPGPWRSEVELGKLRLTIRDREGRKIAERKFPKSLGQARFLAIPDVVHAAVAAINALGFQVMAKTSEALPK